MEKKYNEANPEGNDIPYCPLTEEEKTALKANEDTSEPPAPTEPPAPRPYTSNIRILPSSLTPFHRAYMAQLKAGKDPAVAAEQAEGASGPHSQSEKEKLENARRLKGISKSPILEEGSSKPAGMTPVPQKKARPTKWQFGIRSRNSPLEAIGCIYRALQKLGAQWLIDGEWNGNVDESTEPA